MNRSAIAFALVLLSCALSAQDFALQSGQKYPVSPLIVAPVEKIHSVGPPPGLRMRNTGRALTIGGVVLALSGVVMMSSADALYYRTTYTAYGTQTEGDPLGALGVAATTGGVGMMVTGGILWSKGNKKYKRHLERQNASFTVGANGVTLRYRF